MRTCQMWLFVTGLKWSSGHLGPSNWVLLPSHFTFPSPDSPRWPPSLSPGSRTSWDYIWWRKSKSKDIWGWLCDWMVVGRQKVCPSLIRYNLKLSDGNMGGGGSDINTGNQLQRYKHQHLAQYPPPPPALPIPGKLTKSWGVSSVLLYLILDICPYVDIRPEYLPTAILRIST